MAWDESRVMAGVLQPAAIGQAYVHLSGLKCVNAARARAHAPGRVCSQNRKPGSGTEYVYEIHDIRAITREYVNT